MILRRKFRERKHRFGVLNFPVQLCQPFEIHSVYVIFVIISKTINVLRCRKKITFDVRNQELHSVLNVVRFLILIKAIRI